LKFKAGVPEIFPGDYAGIFTAKRTARRPPMEKEEKKQEAPADCAEEEEI